MELKTVIYSGKKKITITRQASGVSKIKKAMEVVLRGTGYTIIEDIKANNSKKVIPTDLNNLYEGGNMS